jgi:hypothetical protein
VITITWLGPGRTKIAFGTADATGSGRTIVQVRLTKPGRRLLSNTTRAIPVRIIAAFTDLPGDRYTRTASMNLTP